MKRLVFAAVGLYLVAALVTRVADWKGVRFRCGCEADCWCQRPGITTFRWVTPKRWHHRPLTAADKRALAGAEPD